jgi:DNA-binding transcriptional ArsR family regulator
MDGNTPYRVSVEGDDWEQDVDPETIRSVLTSTRLAVLETIRESEPSGISELSELLERNYSNVYADVEVLVEAGVVSLDSNGRGKRPTANVERQTPVISFSRTRENSVGNNELQKPELDENESDWLRSPQDLEASDVGRGDVVWVQSYPLLVLSHSLPEDLQRVSGVVLTIPADEMETSYQRIGRDDWVNGGPGIATAAIPWEIQTVHRDRFTDRVGTIANDTCNSVSIAVQRYIGPSRD